MYGLALPGVSAVTALRISKTLTRLSVSGSERVLLENGAGLSGVPGLDLAQLFEVLETAGQV